MTAFNKTLNPLTQLNELELLELILETAQLKNGLERLYFNQIDINHQNTRGWCLLFEAVSTFSISQLTSILKSNISINIKDSKGRNALFWALYAGNTVAAKLLIEKGIDCYSNIAPGISSLHYSIFRNDFDVFKILTDLIDINILDNKNSTPVMCAVFYDRDKMVQHLINKGANLYHSDDEGYSLFDYALSGKATKSIKVMQQLNVLDDILHYNKNIKKR